MSTVRSGNLGDVTAAGAAGDPGRVALIDPADAEAPRAWRYGDLHAAAGAVARRLLAGGARRGDRVGIVGANSAGYYAVFLGAMRAGLVAVPVNWKLPAATIAHVLRDCGASVVFADAERRDLVGDAPAVQELDAELGGVLGAEAPVSASTLGGEPAAGPPFESVMP